TAISDYLDSIGDGHQVRGVNAKKHTFCSATVSGNVARLVVHDWIEMPLEQAETNVKTWFDDLKIATVDRTRAYGVWALVWCAGQWQPATGEPGRGRYIQLFDKAADRPDDLAQTLLHAALHGASMSGGVLAHLMHRIRTDSRIDPMRAALLRVALNRL